MKLKKLTVVSNHIYILDKFTELYFTNKITIKKSIIAGYVTEKNCKRYKNISDKYMEKRLDYYKDKFKYSFPFYYKISGDNIIIFKKIDSSFNIRQDSKTIFSIL